jgi:penicillin amidase
MRMVLRRSTLPLVALLGFAACDDGGADDQPADTSGEETGSGDTGGDAADDTGADTVGDTADDTTLPDGISIPGLTREAKAHFDDKGVLHLDCATDADCAATLGYFHARDRFEQMDLRRRLTTGRISQLVGAAALSTDTRYRGLFLTRDGRYLEQAMLEYADEKTLELLEAYARGVNAWLADMRAGRNGAALSEEYGFALIREENIPDWQPSDSVASVVALVDNLTNSGEDDLAVSNLIAGLGRDLAYELVGPWSLDRTVVDAGYEARRGGTVGLPSFAPGLSYGSWTGVMRAAMRDPNHLPVSMRETIDGSNNWVIGPDKSASGNALLANDPHLTLSNPAIWYVAVIDAKTNGTGSWHAGGMTFAGLPAVLIGQNEDIAWGATTTYYDQADAYLETLTPDGGGVVFEGEPVPFIEVEHSFEVANASTGVLEPTPVTLRVVPHHGPVLSYDAAAGKAVSLRWTGNEMTTDLNFVASLNLASNIDEARAALENCTSVGQNWVVIDRQGNFGWLPYSNVPLRPWANRELTPWSALPGDGSAEWQGYYSFDDLPQLQNPEAGYIVTANNDMTGALEDGDATNDGYSPLQSSADFGLRAGRIVQLLDAGGSTLTRDDMARIAADTYLLAADILLPALEGAVDGVTLDPADQALADRLLLWDRTCPTGLATSDPEGAPSNDPDALDASVGCMIYHAYQQAARAATFDDNAAANSFATGEGTTEWAGYPSTSAFLRYIAYPEQFDAAHNYWDDLSTPDAVETRGQILVAALAGARAQLESLFASDDPADWLWGRQHRVDLPADLFSTFGIDTYNNGPFANDGGYATVDVATPSAPGEGDFTHQAGPSMRLQCEASSAEVSCQYQLPGGQSQHRTSPNYEDHLPLWLNNTPRALVMDTAAAASTATQTLTISPR